MDQKQAEDVGEKLLEAEAETQQDELQTFGKAPHFRISLRLPRIIFKAISTKPDARWLLQFSTATKRRYFYLTEDWSVELDSQRYPELSGSIVIPEKTDGERFEFDGASIPVPWLVSLLTIGVLRPLGVLLIASIVHDYAFRYGYLVVRRSAEQDQEEKVPVDRHRADDLFRDLITVVNGNRTVGRMAWYFVRLGYWIGVPYNGQKRTGSPPYAVGLSFVLSIVLLGILIWHYTLYVIAFSALALYLALYVLTLHRLKSLSHFKALFSIVFILFAYLLLMRNG